MAVRRLLSFDPDDWDFYLYNDYKIYERAATLKKRKCILFRNTLYNLSINVVLWKPQPWFAY